MDKIEWSDIMNTGNVEVDQQHKQLLDIINKIQESIHNETQIYEIEPIVLILIEHMQFHFNTEEEIIKSLDIDENIKELHYKEHREFEKHLNILKHDIENKEYRKVYAVERFTELFKYLIEWFVEHDLKSDKPMFLNDK